MRACEMPGRAASEMLSSCPCLPSSSCAAGIVKTAIVAPPSESTDPYLAMPAMR
jgi:hypothetical protein